LTFFLLLLGIQEFPDQFRLNINQPVDALVQWMQVNLYNIGNSGIGTGPLRDFLILNVFKPLRLLLTETLPWTVIVFIFAFAALYASGWALSLGVVILTLSIGLIGMWTFTMDTLGQTLVAGTICIVLGIPLGIWSSKSDRVDSILRPILDFLQTIPIFVVDVHHRTESPPVRGGIRSLVQSNVFDGVRIEGGEETEEVRGIVDGGAVQEDQRLVRGTAADVQSAGVVRCSLHTGQ